MFCFDKYKAWNTRSLGKNSGTVSIPPLHPISLMVVVEQTHVTPLMFDRSRTGQASEVLGRRLSVASIVIRPLEQTSITKNNNWTSNVQKRLFNKLVGCHIIRTSLRTCPENKRQRDWPVATVRLLQTD